MERHARELLTYLANGATWLAGAAGLVLAQRVAAAR